MRNPEKEQETMPDTVPGKRAEPGEQEQKKKK